MIYLSPWLRVLILLQKKGTIFVRITFKKDMSPDYRWGSAKTNADAEH
jgi:hypothetical protein